MSRQFYWIVARGEDGKHVLVFGSDKSEDDARQRGLEILGGLDFDIRKLPTRNLTSASHMLKGNRLEDTRSLDTAMKPLVHEKGLRQIRRRLHRRHLDR